MSARRLAWFAAAALAAGTAWAAPTLESRLLRLPDAPVRASISGIVLDPAIAEISGLAASRRSPDRLWAINDSDNGNLLHRITTGGTLTGTFPVEGARNHDWEDLASYELDGESWLLIADTGDNGGLRKEIELIAVREPAADAAPGPLPVAWRLRVVWPDGPRDCEAMAVDPVAREILLVAKKRVPAQVFRVPLPRGTPSGGRLRAEQIATVPAIPQPTEDDLRRAPAGARYMSQITAADLSPDGLRLVLLTYREAYLLPRAPGEAWLDALRRPPQRLHMPPLVQAEAIAFDREGRDIFVGTEKLPAPLIRIAPREAAKPKGP
jgi:hypothetical protein